MHTFLVIILTIVVYVLLHLYCKKKQAPKANRYIISGFGAIATFILIIGSTESKKIESVLQVAPSNHVESAQVKVERPTLALSQWKALYQELETFKAEPIFIEYGFSAGGQKSYQMWLEKVTGHVLPVNVPPAYNATPVNLRQLAMAYIRNDSTTISRLKNELNKVLL